MPVLLDLLPVFTIIAMGLLAVRIGLFPVEFIRTAAKLAFYLGLPFLVFRAVAKADLNGAMVMLPGLVGVAAVFLQWVLGIVLAKLLLKEPKVPAPRRASWVACQIHSNMGIMGLAMVYYGLGELWLAPAALAMALIMLAHTLLVVIILTAWGNGRGGMLHGLASLARNPIIIAAVAGLIYDMIGIKLPVFVDRTVGILADMSLPLALIVIGAELSQWSLDQGKRELVTMSMMKLLVMPALAFVMMTLIGAGNMERALVVILLASPCATVCTILASLLGGDSRFSAAATSLTHALSPLTYFVWMLIVKS